jgi:crotonobetainyl-CoA:carnitine CoA-transferase CaiB-like acyl-CoA transferase
MLRVIDLTTLSGVYAARLFAEQGHEVIRIEPPEGDEVRKLGPVLGEREDLEHGAFHHFLNAGKKSVALDLQCPEDQKALLDLLGEADVLIANAPLPFNEGACLAANGRLVLTKIVDDAPELCAVARSGLMSLTGHPNRAPMVLGGHIPMMAVATYVAVATAAALLARNASGRGLVATVSVRESLESFVEQAMIEYSFSGTITERRGSRGAITAVSGAMPCKDGHWVISQIHRPGRWSKFVDWVQDPELSADESLAEEKNQQKRRDFIMQRLDAWAARFNKTELVEQAQRRHFPASPVSTTLDLVDDPQLVARGFLTEMNHRDFGTIKFPQGAIASILRHRLGPAPKLGEHNDQILGELHSPRGEKNFTVGGDRRSG